MGKVLQMFKPQLVEAAAKVHPDWEWLDRRMRKVRNLYCAPRTPAELQAWFIETYPEESRRLQAEAELLEKKMFGDTKH